MPSDEGAKNSPLIGPMPATFAISRFAAPAWTVTRPTTVALTWAAVVELLTTHTRREDKDGAGWSGATYRAGTTRSNANVEAWSLAVADFDECSMADYEAVVGHVQGHRLAFVVYSTYNNAPPDGVRFRLVVPLARPVPAER